jgi:NAD(P)H dehydrogenase (quinone)
MFRIGAPGAPLLKFFGKGLLDMVLVTGAAGKTGRAIIKALALKKRSVRALIRKPDQSASVTSAGATEVCLGDLRNEADLVHACRGIRAVYAIVPNMCSDETEVGSGILHAAKTAGVRHFVYHSVLHPQVEAMPHHWQKMHVEALLFESGLDYTILQPVAYMQNVLAYWQTIVDNGVYSVPYHVDTRLGMVDLRDVADVAALVLTEAGHQGATYELASDERLSQVEVARIISKALSKEVRPEETPRQIWEERVRKAGLDEYSISTLLKMFRYYENYGFWGNATVLTRLINRSPVTFEAFIRRTVKEMGNS